ncbi:MAG: hypothetical protein AAF717_08300 [Bacteroidota bacterium]
MLKRLLHYITEGNTFFVLEIYERQAKQLFSFQKVVLAKGELEVIVTRTSANLEAILPLVEKKKPLLLTLNTANVLSKVIPATAGSQPELWVTTAFPNLPLDHFYYQLFQHHATTVISIAKKEYVAQYLEQFKKLGIPVYTVSLGLAALRAIVNYADEGITGSNFELQWKNGQPMRYTPLIAQRSDKMDIGGFLLESEQLLGFAQVLDLFDQEKKVSNSAECNHKLQNEIKNLRLFDFGIKTALAFFIALLLSNFLLFNYYHSKNQALEASLASNQLQEQSFTALKERVSAKEERLEVLQHSKDSRASWYLDELGKSIPGSIRLTTVHFQPLSLPVRSNAVIVLQERHLQVSGITYDRIAFGNWSESLENRSWINTIEVVDYNYVSNSAANFTLNLVLDATEFEK